MRYELYYGDTFVNTIKKYSKYKNIYVQFLKDDLGFSKELNQSPTHHDPIGQYAYPISYVANNPMHIDYGNKMPYMRILKDRSKNKLVLNNLSLEEAKAQLTDLYGNEVDGYINWFNKRLYFDNMKNTGGNLLYMSIKFFDDGTIRPNSQQSKLWLKLGYDSLEDKAMKPSKAIINVNEPKQICFLTESSFDVLENLHIGEEKQNRYTLRDKLLEITALALKDTVVDDMPNGFKTNKGFITGYISEIESDIDTKYSDFYGFTFRYVLDSGEVIADTMKPNETVGEYVHRLSKMRL